ncbi:MAG: hypothetical protein ACRERR_09605 [Moraxellaceae bacterium]
MKTIAMISARPNALRNTVGAAITLAGAGLMLHAGLVTLAALSASAAAALSLATTLLLALAAVAVTARIAHAAIQPEPIPLAVPAARPWR